MAGAAPLPGPVPGPAPSARELILELVELQDRIDEVRLAEPAPSGHSPDGAMPPQLPPQLPPELPPELVELEEREEEVIAELRDYRETQLRLPAPPPP